jgi:hypothetical protein
VELRKVAESACSQKLDLHHFIPKLDAKPSENKTVVLGDMMLTQNQFQVLFSNETLRRHGLERTFAHWPAATVPFKFDTSIVEALKTTVLGAMEYISSRSCVKFKYADASDSNFVLVTTGPGCSSAVGNLRQGQQKLRLSHLCERGNVIHELLHTLGFLHMHVCVFHRIPFEFFLRFF